ncbi:hypothetical protein FRC07_011775 [Ceratobasidium sp. 392]|nr:hypothetical protein FRC07_011775 [Ceratobasidium sp. 392]
MSHDFYAHLQADMAEVLEQYRDAPTKVDDKVFEEEIDWYCRDNKELAKPMKAWFNQTLNALDQHEDPPELPVPEDMRLPKDELPKASHGPILAKALVNLHFGTVKMNSSSQDPDSHVDAPKRGSPLARRQLSQNNLTGVKRQPQAKLKIENDSYKSDMKLTPAYNPAATVDPALGIRLGFYRQLPIEDVDTFSYWIEKKIFEVDGKPTHWHRTVTNYRFEDSGGNMVSIAVGGVPEDEELYLVGLAGPIGAGWEPSERLMAGHWAQDKDSHARSPVEIYWVKARIREITSSAHDFFRGGRTKVLAAWSDTSVYVMQACGVNFAQRFERCKVEPKKFSDVPVTRNSFAPKWMSVDVFKILQDEHEAGKKSQEKTRLTTRDKVPLQPLSVRKLLGLEGELVQARWLAKQLRQEVLKVEASSQKSKSTVSTNAQALWRNATYTQSMTETKIKELKDAGLDSPLRHSSPESECYYKTNARSSSTVETSGNDSIKRRKTTKSPSPVESNGSLMDMASTSDVLGEPEVPEGSDISSAGAASAVIYNSSQQDDSSTPSSPTEPNQSTLPEDDTAAVTCGGQKCGQPDAQLSSSASAPVPVMPMRAIFGVKKLTPAPIKVPFF